jgi:wyosine [tRNA(Phe)-imidazoG37] synthetase (radical SAM superfamily)
MKTTANPEPAPSACQPEPPAQKVRTTPPESAFGYPRNFLGNRLVYVVVSARARGLSIGVNMNPDRHCNFDCVYCEVERGAPAPRKPLDVPAMVEELRRTLTFVHSNQIRQSPAYSTLPAGLLELRHVALSGDGEPTLCPNFTEAMEAIVHIRALGAFPFYKLVLVTNATGLDLAPVQESLSLLTRQDEVWAKLDVGTQAAMDKVNRPQVPLEKVLANILMLGRKRPVIIQSLFPLLDRKEPSEEEIEQYARRLEELKASGAMISLVQIYSATRPMAHSVCGHLPLKSLSHIAQAVRSATGLRVEVY